MNDKKNDGLHLHSRKEDLKRRADDATMPDLVAAVNSLTSQVATMREEIAPVLEIYRDARVIRRFLAWMIGILALIGGTIEFFWNVKYHAPKVP